MISQVVAPTKFPRQAPQTIAEQLETQEIAKGESLTWDELEKLVIDRGYDTNPDLVNGPTSYKSKLRLFGQKEEDVRVTLFRDEYISQSPQFHKVWLWLEENKVPYRVEKTIMVRSVNSSEKDKEST